MIRFAQAVPKRLVIEMNIATDGAKAPLKPMFANNTSTKCIAKVTPKWRMVRTFSES